MLRLAAVLLLSVCFVANAQNKTDAKLKLVIPSIKLTDVTVKDALLMIQKKSKEIDPDKTGVVIVIQEQNQKLLNRKVTFDFNKIPVKDAIKYTCMSSNLHYRVNDTGTAVIVSSKVATQVVTKFYTVSSIFKSYVNPKNTRLITQEKLKEFFATGGVTFPKGSQVSYLAGKNMVTFTNTNVNQDKAKKLLANLGCLR